MNELLTAQGIRKDYGATRALDSVDISVNEGQVVALLGANGSGKSTLTKILTGAASANEGHIEFASEPFVPRSPMVAQKLGVVAVAQELSLVPSMTVAQNIWLGAQPNLPKTRGSLSKRQDAATKPLLELFADVSRENVGPQTRVSELSPDECQLVEILKAIARQPKLLILDEATSTLDRSQVSRLFELMREWGSAGMGIIFVSHRMEEVFTISHEVCVIRGGRTVLACSTQDVTREAVVSAMTGHSEAGGVPTGTAEASARTGEPVLALRDFSAKGITSTTLQLRRGEILGFGGLQRQGQSALLRAIGGGHQSLSGDLEIEKQPTKFRSPGDAMRAGVHYVGGDRKELAFSQRSIQENLLATAWSRFGPVLRARTVSSTATGFADKLGVKRASLDHPLSSLSGGNAQKVLLARALVNEPSVLILDDPTKGVDVMTKQQIYVTLRELRRQGTAILLYSSEDEELLDLADRVLVFHDGGVVAELKGRHLTKQALVSASMGIRHSEEEGNIDVR
ncbi:sugar ABC transporter ATP-binding protein [Arthrobacter globiformis]|uniref:sugar ABC transporter ATP-binding protein n=1 Tax=Arthrobacter globiformis TaxID=1665 RepID=UPI002785C21F|nr:sugar ABC transporter ATP-binding protein [Arthrobacter globiformis]MDQ0867343.1 ribose transport system ATP-binding protein [Arthrobacter globiformis]